MVSTRSGRKTSANAKCSRTPIQQSQTRHAQNQQRDAFNRQAAQWIADNGGNERSYRQHLHQRMLDHEARREAEEKAEEGNAKQLIWDYMKVKHELVKPVDCIFALGTFDTAIAKHAAELYHQGYSKILAISGSGTVNAAEGAWKKFQGRTEASVFAEIAMEAGVPKDAIVLEEGSQNTGQNYEFMTQRLKERGIDLKSVIAVQKPFMERRTYATGKVWWPDVNLIVTSPPSTLQEYSVRMVEEGNDDWVHYMVGDLQRIIIYPDKGFQIEQEVPEDVEDAYKLLVDVGYIKKLVPED